jgi:UDP-N-acetylglucosamine transferase subunit ALG13
VPKTVHLAGSPGGHLDLLAALATRLGEDVDRVWVTGPGRRADDLAARGETVRVVPDTGRAIRPVVRNVLAAARLVLRTRPRLVICSGAGLTVAFCLFARARGAKLLWVETTARVDDASRSGRLVSRFAERVFVQWPETARRYPGAVLCRPALWEEVRPPAGDAAGDGTFVAVGTHGAPFDRLLAAVDDAVGAGILPTPVVAQAGPSGYRPRHYSTVPWLTAEEVDLCARRAQVVVCHAGSGIIAATLRSGRAPLVLPRLRAHGEHVDDHQAQLANKLAESGLAVVLDGEIRPEQVAAGTRLSLVRPEDAPSVADAVRSTIAEMAIA